MSTYVDETIAKYEKYINPAQAKLFRFMGLDSVEAKAEGWIITDSEGQEFIDCLGGYGMFALGLYSTRYGQANGRSHRSQRHFPR